MWWEAEAENWIYPWLRFSRGFGTKRTRNKEMEYIREPCPEVQAGERREEDGSVGGRDVGGAGTSAGGSWAESSGRRGYLRLAGTSVNVLGVTRPGHGPGMGC